VDTRELLHEVADRAADWLDVLPHRPIAPARTPEKLKITRTLTDSPVPVERVIAELVEEAAPGLTGINSPRFFGFVMGGAHPAGIAADWLVTAWDQNSGLAATNPATAAFEEVAGRWLAALLGLPETASFAFVTGCQMAHVTCLAAARHSLYRRAGWDLPQRGLAGARRRSASSSAASAT
jgi:glutamate/tyrosine decarboxylase-like PLP-dependent enzyme